MQSLLLFIKAFLSSLLQVGLFALAFLIPSETWYWFDAIIFLIFYSVMLLTACAYLCIFHPASIEARLMIPYAPNQPVEDKFATAFLVMAFSIGLTFISLDVFHFQIFLGPSFEVKCLGLVVHTFGFLITILTLIQNEFAQPVVNLQKERGQVLVDSGLYGYIRHPMYFGLIFYLSGMALWLGSTFMATFGTMIVMVAFVPRILIEEKILRSELDGYENYMKRVQYRIIPRVF